MLTALDEQGAARVVRVVEEIIVAHPPAGCMTCIMDNYARHPDFFRKIPAFSVASGQDKRLSLILHGMDVQHDIRFVDDRPDLAGPGPLQAASVIIEDIAIPDAVEILVDEPGKSRIVGPELGIDPTRGRILCRNR